VQIESGSFPLGILPIFETFCDKSSSRSGKLSADEAVGSLLCDGVLEPAILIKPVWFEAPSFWGFQPENYFLKLVFKRTRGLISQAVGHAHRDSEGWLFVTVFFFGKKKKKKKRRISTQQRTEENSKSKSPPSHSPSDHEHHTTAFLTLHPTQWWWFYCDWMSLIRD